jgi:pimeloyl-ACP methyl ester carboxylesterase
MKLELAGATIDYDVRGDGPLVVNLHGLSASRELTRRMDLDLTVGLDGHRVLSYDARGHGLSTGADDPNSYAWPSLADDLSAILDAIGTEGPVDAIGASMGTATILHAAVRRPERFRRLVLTIPPTAWETRVAQGAAYRQAAKLVRARGVAAFITATSAVLPPPPVVADLPWVAEPAITESLLPSVLEGAALSDLPDPAEIARITAPTLLLPWSGDPGHPLSTAERLAELLPDSRTIVASETATPGDGRWRNT